MKWGKNSLENSIAECSRIEKEVKVMHINMNILNTYTIVLVQINLIARIVLMAVEITETVKGMEETLVCVSLIKTIVWVSIYNYITFITYAALLFSSDYETNRRIWVSFLLIICNSLISCSFAFLLVYDYLNGVIYVLLVFCVSNLSCALFMVIKAENIREDERLNSFNFRRNSYTISQRWQVKDNVKLAMESRSLVLGGAVQISFYLPFFFLPPLYLGDKPEWRATLEMSKAVFQLISSYGFAIAELYVLFTFSRQRDFIKSLVGIQTTSVYGQHNFTWQRGALSVNYLWNVSRNNRRRKIRCNCVLRMGESIRIQKHKLYLESSNGPSLDPLLQFGSVHNLVPCLEYSRKPIEESRHKVLHRQNVIGD
ncbi:hypothetical protein PRIPAC_81337 [Pristionchus pacificus]|uniref:G protein-coupled receptor n=1 Tax=Pristionchus pacificus TaxID=54126 RepID=A0A2A6C2I8_PRIPA|nr:hypothetical protein PRIPAC_81337 [Pristionchus pacificus]|eukprot:PDM72307.1 G protein-coupled receptor [Pristionchus pacificus]